MHASGIQYGVWEGVKYRWGIVNGIGGIDGWNYGSGLLSLRVCVLDSREWSDEVCMRLAIVRLQNGLSPVL